VDARDLAQTVRANRRAFPGGRRTSNIEAWAVSGRWSRRQGEPIEDHALYTHRALPAEL